MVTCRPTPQPELPSLFTSSLPPPSLSLGSPPDRKFVALLLEGLHESFCICYDYSGAHCRVVQLNMKSAGKNPKVVDDYFVVECEMGRAVSPLSKAKREAAPPPSPCQSVWGHPQRSQLKQANSA